MDFMEEDDRPVDTATDVTEPSLYAEDLGSFSHPDQLEEPSMVAVPAPTQEVPEGGPTTYKLVKSATNRGKVDISQWILIESLIL